MKALIYLMLMGVLTAHNSLLTESQEPTVIKPFSLSYEDFNHYPSTLKKLLFDGGSVLVHFVIDETGNVVETQIVDTFDIILNEVIIEKVNELKFEPASQNGRPVRVKYSLPILFQ